MSVRKEKREEMLDRMIVKNRRYHSNYIESTNSDNDFLIACKYGHTYSLINLLKLNGNKRVDVHTLNNKGFYLACVNNRVGVFAELLSLKDNRWIDIHSHNFGAFRRACEGNSAGVVGIFLQLTGSRETNLHLIDHNIFKNACVDGHFTIILEFLRLKGYRRVPTDEIKFILSMKDYELPYKEEIAIMILKTRLDMFRLECKDMKHRLNFLRVNTELSLLPSYVKDDLLVLKNFPGGHRYLGLMSKWNCQN